MDEAAPALPDHRDLSRNQLGFLNEHFRTFSDLDDALRLRILLSDTCSDLSHELKRSQHTLGRLVVSWMSRSVAAKRDVELLNFEVEKLGLSTSRCGSSWKMMQRIIREDLPLLTREIRRVEAVRNYVETTLELEALVGDLEDVNFSIMSLNAGNMFFIGIATPRTRVSRPGHESLLQAVKVMNDIEELLALTIKSHPQWSHLVKSVDSRVDKILTVLRPKVIADHRSLLLSLGWPPNLLSTGLEGNDISALPNPLLLMQPDKKEAYTQSFTGICALQHLQSQREQRKLKRLGQKDSYRVLWAIDELVSPIALRTEYHFSKWANEQPKFFFALVYRITRDFSVGIDEVLQPLIDKARLAGCSAKEAWVFAMVQMLSGFLDKSVFPHLADRYRVKNMKEETISMWIHLVDLMIASDKQMTSLLSSEPGRLDGVSRGISVLSIFNTRAEWLKLWAKIELKDAWKRLKAEMTDEKCWSSSNNPEAELTSSTEHGQLHTSQECKVPVIAELATKLIWEMIERGQSLPHISLQVRFIRLTACRFFWYFLKVLLLRCKRLEQPEHEPGDDTLLRVCEALNAARFIESKLLEWSDDVAFLEMLIVESDMEASSRDNFNAETHFFSEELKGLVELQTNGLMEIITEILCQFEDISRDYIHNVQFFEHTQATHNQAIVSSDPVLPISHTFVLALDLLCDRLLMLKASLNPPDYLDLWRSVADGVDHFVLNSILETGVWFSPTGISQFDTDMKALFHVFKPFCERPEAFLPRIRYTLQLLQTDKTEASRILSRSHPTEYSQKCTTIPQLRPDQIQKIMNMRKNLDSRTPDIKDGKCV